MGKLVLGVAALVMVVGFFSFVFSIFYFGISSGVYALVSIVWFEAINTTGAVPHVFLPTLAWSRLRVLIWVPRVPRDTQPFSCRRRKASIVFLCPWLACLLLSTRKSTSGISLGSDWWNWCVRN